MYELKDAVNLAFIDLEESYLCDWRAGKGSKDSLIEAFSQREVPPYKYLNFQGSDGLRHAFGRALPNNNKPKNKKWEDWILSRIGLYYCSICKKVHDQVSDTPCNSIRDRSENRDIVSEAICEYLRHNPCIECGEPDIRVLEFDHLDPTTKLFNVGDRSNRSIDSVFTEIAKCRVLCANCHRKHTAITQQHFKHIYYTKHMVP